MSNFIDVQAFANSLDVITLAGKHLKEVLHHSISTQYKQGGFLQMAGRVLIGEDSRFKIQEGLLTNVHEYIHVTKLFASLT